ncbi:hypothetical protein AK88_04286 [Plasmodium fragile]|uniref:Schizont-infected cell agglutination C-terminal domain-containing protein n=1 Tax=Plasmodium fragile TaxID=5857 RepID=A0A0D9QGD1_PLAFR|nr:uncharacterized protein AK88_04286 [Plasmodium fragile]KJP86095.1 hypothetical protein AK88_04286 [Plasmodium fragile]
MVWEKTKDVMQEFVLYMDTAEITSYAANCDNAAWDHHKNPTAGSIYFGQTVGDKIICVLMAGALFFMNGWTITQSTRSTEDEISERIREHLRCAIVHMFSAVLDESVCPGMRGTFYAWKTMERMDTGDGGFPEGLIKRGICGRELSSNLQIRQLDLNTKVKQWLRQDSRLKGVIQKIKGNALCTKRWQDAWNLEDILGNGNTQDTQALQIAPIVDELKKGINDLLTELGKKVDQDVKNRQQAKNRKLGETGEVWAEGNKLERRRQDKYTEHNYRQCRSNRENAKGNNMQISNDDKNAQPATTKAAPPQAPPGEVDVSGHKNTKQEDAEAEPAPAAPPITSTPSGPAAASPVPPAPPAEKSDQTVATGGTVDGGNDDPPPLNPPKPKPNPNPNQSGSSGSFSDADLADGVSGGEVTAGGSGGGGGSSGGGGGSQLTSGSSNQNDQDTGNTTQGGTKQFELDLASPALNIEGATGGFVPPVPADGEVSSSGETPRDYAVPDLTGMVLTATTPVLFFLASVIVALLGYSLWKYFAYLAKRRRTYRTVRDVPSRPLDEEILDHLQRGELPPPAYWYTMVRDRRPASTSARGRPPRVHRRTIIELHLEVLNECEAAEWENVKDDYWKIVVQEFAQEFAQDMIRDDDTNNNILGVSTAEHGSAGTNVSSTESDGIDRCPPNEHDPDPCKCMETIHFDTDRCPPNVHDRWHCMESIQLPTDPFPPNDCDPWSCMETKQFATDPCPPNEDDSDAWKCMETI